MAADEQEVVVGGGLWKSDADERGKDEKKERVKTGSG
jgi:hypothetical protein